MADIGSVILRSLHFKCSSPKYVAEELELNMRLLAYKLACPLTATHAHNRAKIPPNIKTDNFLVSMLSGGWISVYNDSFFALEEIARRCSLSLGSKCIYLWAEPGVSWGYSYYTNGQLGDEFCSGIEDLYISLFDGPPTEEERQKLVGEPQSLLNEFANRTVTPEYLAKLFLMDKQYAKGCMVKFAQIFGIQTAGRTYDIISALPESEKYDKERFSLYRFVPLVAADRVDEEEPAS